MSDQHTTSWPDIPTNPGAILGGVSDELKELREVVTVGLGRDGHGGRLGDLERRYGADRQTTRWILGIVIAVGLGLIGSAWNINRDLTRDLATIQTHLDYLRDDRERDRAAP